MHNNLLLIHTSYFIMWQDYQNTFINATGSSLEHIREMLAAFIIRKSLVQRENFISVYRL
jgi:hypothetical protein